MLTGALQQRIKERGGELKTIPWQAKERKQGIYSLQLPDQKTVICKNLMEANKRFKAWQDLRWCDYTI